MKKLILATALLAVSSLSMANTAVSGELPSWGAPGEVQRPMPVDGVQQNHIRTQLNALAISGLQQDIERLDGRIDGMGAMSQAINSARPELAYGSKIAIGVGFGTTNSTNAIAASAVFQVSTNLTGNMTVSTVSGETNDVSFGAGVGYSF